MARTARGRLLAAAPDEAGRRGKSEKHNLVAGAMSRRIKPPGGQSSTSWYARRGIGYMRSTIVVLGVAERCRDVKLLVEQFFLTLSRLGAFRKQGSRHSELWERAGIFDGVAG